MTSNEYDKAQSICSELATAATNLVNAVDALVAIRSKKDATGFDLTDNGFEAHLAGGGFKYITDGNDFNNVMGSATTLKAWLVDNGHWGVFQKVRP
jgi:hypothetical protein